MNLMYVRPPRLRGVVFQEPDGTWTVQIEHGPTLGGWVFREHADEELARLCA